MPFLAPPLLCPPQYSIHHARGVRTDQRQRPPCMATQCRQHRLELSPSVCLLFIRWQWFRHVPSVPEKDSIASHPPNDGVQLRGSVRVNDVPIFLLISANYILEILSQSRLMSLLPGSLMCWVAEGAYWWWGGGGWGTGRNNMCLWWCPGWFVAFLVLVYAWLAVQMCSLPVRAVPHLLDVFGRLCGTVRCTTLACLSSSPCAPLGLEVA